jgi:hypothetical protein
MPTPRSALVTCERELEPVAGLVHRDGRDGLSALTGWCNRPAADTGFGGYGEKWPVCRLGCRSENRNNLRRSWCRNDRLIPTARRVLVACERELEPPAGLVRCDGRDGLPALAGRFERPFAEVWPSVWNGGLPFSERKSRKHRRVRRLRGVLLREPRIPLDHLHCRSQGPFGFDPANERRQQALLTPHEQGLGGKLKRLEPALRFPQPLKR